LGTINIAINPFKVNKRLMGFYDKLISGGLRLAFFWVSLEVIK
jgi:hypothetical protein